MTNRVLHTSYIGILSSNCSAWPNKTAEISRILGMEAGSWTNHNPDTSPAGEVVPDQDLEMVSEDRNNGIGGKYG